MRQGGHAVGRAGRRFGAAVSVAGCVLAASGTAWPAAAADHRAGQQTVHRAAPHAAQPAVEIKLPANAASTSQLAHAVSVSCSRVGSCVAGGSYDDTSFAGRAMAVARSSGHWRRATELPLPSDAFTNPNAQINGLACFGPGSCTGVGAYEPITTVGRFQAMVSTESSGVWRRAFAVKLPPDSLLKVNANLLAVSCVRRGSCVAVGFYEDSASRTDLMAVTESGGKWRRAVKVALPANADTSAGAGAELTGVACVTELSCFAVGEYTTQTGKLEAIAVTMSNGRWRRATEIGPPTGAPANPNAGLNSVACPKAGSCQAVGTYRDLAGVSQGMAVSRSGGRWKRAIKMPLPATSPGAQFDSVACTGVGSCVAVGQLITNATFNGVAVRSVESHGIWAKPVKVPTPANAGTGTKLFSILFAVTCVASRACVTVGGYQDNAGDLSEGMAAVIPAP